jgi:excisionase family DNA binding protein
MTVTPPKPGRLVFSVEEVAERLGVHPNTVRDMIHEGAFRARQVGRVWKIPVSAFGEYLDGRDNPARVMSIDEVAEALSVHRDTVSKMLNAGTIRAVRAGRTWKIPLSALEEFLAGRDNPPTEETQPEE